MPAQSPTTPAAKGSKLPWIIVIVLLLAIAGGGGWWFMQARAAPAAVDGAQAPAAPGRAPAQYYALEPAFVVNLADTDAVRYLQADVQLVTRDTATATALQLHTPAIRNRLLLLFGQQSAAQLTQRSGKERLQEKAKAEVTAVLKAEAAPAKVEAVLFTSLVTQ